LEHLISIEFAGTVQCDGYSAYDRFASRREEEGQPVVLAGCWAHYLESVFIWNEGRGSRLGPLELAAVVSR
jgi:Transposase IS66 family